MKYKEWDKWRDQGLAAGFTFPDLWKLLFIWECPSCGALAFNWKKHHEWHTSSASPEQEKP